MTTAPSKNLSSIGTQIISSLLAIGLVIFVKCSTCIANTESHPVRPNFVYILVDDLGYGDVNLGLPELDAFKNPFIKTPRLAEFAEQSVVFTHHYAAAPTCSPSRAGLMTGRTPTRVNITQWISDKRDNDRFFMRGAEVTIAELLQAAGYTTAVIGKWHLNGADWEDPNSWTGWTGSFPRQQGFDFSMITKENPHLTRKLNLNSQENPGDYFLNDGQPMGTIEGFSSEIITDAALDWLQNKRDKDKPFFLYLPYDAVHEIISSPPRFEAMYDTGIREKNQYFANVTFVDYCIGKFLDGLEALGLEENTVVFFSSDNGPDELRINDLTDRSFGVSYPLFGQKRQLYEGGIRVPGMVRWSGKIAHRISELPNSTVDVLPTVCAMAGVEVPDKLVIDGADISEHLLADEPVNRTRPLYWQIEMRRDWQLQGEGYDRRFDGKAEKKNAPVPQVVIRQGNYVLRGLHTGKAHTLPTEFELYDVQNDPQERQELYKLRPDLFHQMRRQLEEMHRGVERDRQETERWVQENRKKKA